MYTAEPTQDSEQWPVVYSYVPAHSGSAIQLGHNQANVYWHGPSSIVSVFGVRGKGLKFVSLWWMVSIVTHDQLK